MAVAVLVGVAGERAQSSTDLGASGGCARTLVFDADVSGFVCEHSAIYLSCADGSSRRRLTSVSE